MDISPKTPLGWVTAVLLTIGAVGALLFMVVVEGRGPVFTDASLVLWFLVPATLMLSGGATGLVALFHDKDRTFFVVAAIGMSAATLLFSGAEVLAAS